MAGRILNATSDIEDGQMIQMLLGSWFSQTRSTEQMRIGTKNEDAVLTAFRSYNFVTDVFSCGLLESKNVPWLAASPDAIAIIKNPNGNKVLAPVEVKTRVSTQRIAEAEKNAAKYNNKVIICGLHCNNVDEVMNNDHATQIMIQMSTTSLQYAVYLAATPGTSNTKGRTIYTVIVFANEDIMADFRSKLMERFDEHLRPFFTSTNINEVMESLPTDLTTKHQE
jgi:hypothetical protein